MKNKYLKQINTDGITNLLLEFTEAQLKTNFTTEEVDGVVKFIIYLMNKWEVL